jgi:hypothetical protein
MVKNIAVFLLLLIPPISKVLYPSSMHLGFSLLTITIVSYSLIFGIKLNKKLNFYLLLFISIDLTLKIINNSYYEKLVYHYILLFLLFNASFCLYKLIEDDFIDVRKTCNYIITGLLVIGLLGYFNFNPLDKGGRPLFIFDEPSHYIIYLSPFFLFYMLYGENKIYKILVFISVYLIVGLLVKSLLAFVLCLLFIFLVFFHDKKIFFFYIAIAALIFIGFQFLDSGKINHYISDRVPSISLNAKENIGNMVLQNQNQKLNASEEGFFDKRMNLAIENSYNGSLLVMLSGYQRAYAILYDKNYLGLGFNNLGRVGPKLSAMEKIERVYGGPLNLLDAGSLSPKIISEFGVLGLTFLFFYIYKYIKIVKLSINNYRVKDNDISYLFYSIYLSSLILIFFRYTSIFSVESLLMISSFFYFYKSKNS